MKIGNKAAGVKIRNWKTGMTYESIAEAARLTGLRAEYIRDCVNGRRPAAGWERI